MGQLLVFLHVAVKQRALQGELESALPGHTVTAVGRVGDFDRALAEGQDAVLSAGPVLRARNLTVRLQGFRAGTSDEAYALVAEGGSPDPARVQTVGALDLLGREGTTAFVQELLGTTPKIERVSKVEDLLPLLQMQRADAIVMPARLVEDLRHMSQLDLASRELPRRVALPGVALVDDGARDVLSAVARMPRALASSLGVDEWR